MTDPVADLADAVRLGRRYADLMLPKDPDRWQPWRDRIDELLAEIQRYREATG